MRAAAANPTTKIAVRTIVDKRRSCLVMGIVLTGQILGALRPRVKRPKRVIFRKSKETEATETRFSHGGSEKRRSDGGTSRPDRLTRVGRALCARWDGADCESAVSSV